MRTIEKWKDVKGFYRGLYEVSSLGRVRSKDRKIKAPQPWGGTGYRRYKGRILKAGVGSKGYLHVVFTKNSRRESFTVHHLVATAFINKAHSSHEVCHNDGSKTNNKVTNLRWDTRSSNARDKVIHRLLKEKK